MQEEFNDIKLTDIKDDYDYSKFSNIEGFIIDSELKNKFVPIAKKLNLSQESVDMLLDIALQMSRKQKMMYENDTKIKHDDEIASYNRLLTDDKDIPDKNSGAFREYMALANKAYTEFCSPDLKSIFKKTGLVFHPELIKMFHHIAELSQEDDLSYGGKPVFEELTPAQILYGTKE